MLFYATNFVVIRCLIHIENEYEWLWLRVTRKGVPHMEGLSGDRKEWRASSSQVHGGAKEDCWGEHNPGVGQCRGGASNVQRRAWTRLQRGELSVNRGQLYSQQNLPKGGSQNSQGWRQTQHPTVYWLLTIKWRLAQGKKRWGTNRSKWEVKACVCICTM